MNKNKQQHHLQTWLLFAVLVIGYDKNIILTKQWHCLWSSDRIEFVLRVMAIIQCHHQRKKALLPFASRSPYPALFETSWNYQISKCLTTAPQISRWWSTLNQTKITNRYKINKNGFTLKKSDWITFKIRIFFFPTWSPPSLLEHGLPFVPSILPHLTDAVMD